MPEYRLDNFEILTANSSQNIEKNLKIVWLNFDLPKSTPPRSLMPSKTVEAHNLQIYQQNPPPMLQKSNNHLH